MSSLSVIDKLEVLEQENNKQFAPYEEEAIVSLALDHPELFMSAARFMKPDMFMRIEVRLIIAEILNSYEQYSIIPTRKLLRSKMESYITEDDKFEEIFRIVDRQSEPREIPIIKDTLLKWSRTRAYGLLYSEDAVAAYHRGDFTYLEEIVNSANRIADIGNNGFWFFEDYQLLFQPDAIQHRTTGFPKLDKCLNNGGPSAKEVVCYLSATNVGKCHTDQTLIIEERLSRIYELELEDGSFLNLRGSREVQTTRGRIKVADLTEEDCFTEVPVGCDGWSLEL